MARTEIGTSEALLEELRAWVLQETPTTDPKAVNALADWNGPAAEQEFQTALRLQPHDSLTHLWYAIFVLLPRQDYAAAEGEARSAIQANPLSLIAHTDLGWILEDTSSAAPGDADADSDE